MFSRAPLSLSYATARIMKFSFKKEAPDAATELHGRYSR
jgi:hypothetical protein